MKVITQKHRDVAEQINVSCLPKEVELNEVRCSEILSIEFPAPFPEPLTESKAREVLGDWIMPESHLHAYFGLNYVDWSKGAICSRINGTFTAEQLKAIAWWMENKGAK